MLSTKTQYVVKEAHRLIQRGEKLLVYNDWPSSVWLLKTTFDTAGIKCGRISAGQSAKERSMIMEKFNDPDDHSVDVLACSSRSAAESYNFQRGCHNIIIMDVVGFMTVLQIIGRCYRIGQKHEQFIKILTLNRTYDQVLLSRAATSMVAQLSATSGGVMDDITDEQCRDALKDTEFAALVAKNMEQTKQTELAQTRDQLYDRIIHEKFRRNFGVRTDRDNDLWGHPSAVDAKLLIPEERAFFQSLGGKFAVQIEELFADAGLVPQVTSTPQAKGQANYEKYLQKTQKREQKQEERAAKKRKLAEATEAEAAHQAQKARLKRIKVLREMEQEDEGDYRDVIAQLEEKCQQCKCDIIPRAWDSTDDFTDKAGLRPAPTQKADKDDDVVMGDDSRQEKDDEKAEEEYSVEDEHSMEDEQSVEDEHRIEDEQSVEDNRGKPRRIPTAAGFANRPPRALFTYAYARASPRPHPSRDRRHDCGPHGLECRRCRHPWPRRQHGACHPRAPGYEGR
jgi:hypothetical protein